MRIWQKVVVSMPQEFKHVRQIARLQILHAQTGSLKMYDTYKLELRNSWRKWAKLEHASASPLCPISQRRATEAQNRNVLNTRLLKKVLLKLPQNWAATTLKTLEFWLGRVINLLCAGQTLWAPSSLYQIPHCPKLDLDLWSIKRWLGGCQLLCGEGQNG
jgi:hypothetical protein